MHWGDAMHSCSLLVVADPCPRQDCPASGQSHTRTDTIPRDVHTWRECRIGTRLTLPSTRQSSDMHTDAYAVEAQEPCASA